MFEAISTCRDGAHVLVQEGVRERKDAARNMFVVCVSQPQLPVPTYVYTFIHTYYSCPTHTPSACSLSRGNAITYVSIRQHTSAYVRIRQHTSAYVSTCTHLFLPHAYTFCLLVIARQCHMPHTTSRKTLLLAYVCVCVCVCVC
jgi:hypothetical protein